MEVFLWPGTGFSMFVTKLASALKDSGFRQSHSDYSLFIYSHSNIFLCVVIHVVDLIITVSHPVAIQSFKNHLHAYFHMKNLGHLKYFFGIEVARKSQGMYLCQRKYVLDIFSGTGLL